MTLFVQQLRYKGWTAVQVAKRWNCTPRHITRIGRNPKQKDWDALEGLPYRELKPDRRSIYVDS